jgi:hypothetical protein
MRKHLLFLSICAAVVSLFLAYKWLSDSEAGTHEAASKTSPVDSNATAQTNQTPNEPKQDVASRAVTSSNQQQQTTTDPLASRFEAIEKMQKRAQQSAAIKGGAKFNLPAPEQLLELNDIWVDYPNWLKLAHHHADIDSAAAPDSILAKIDNYAVVADQPVTADSQSNSLNAYSVIYNPDSKSYAVVTGLLSLKLHALSDLTSLVRDHNLFVINSFENIQLAIVRPQGRTLEASFIDLKSDPRIAKVELEIIKRSREKN